MDSIAHVNGSTTVDEFRPLHPAIRKVWQYGTLISSVIFLAMALPAEFFLVRMFDSWPIPFPVLSIVVVGGMGALSWFMAYKQYENWRYALRKDDLVLSYGVLWRTRRCVARDRVQHVDINSGPLDRRFGLVQVSIYTAGAMGGIGSIPGLTPEEAEHLRSELLSGRGSGV